MEKIILSELDFNKLKTQVKNNKGKEIIFTSTDDELNRKVIEKLGVSGVLIYLNDRKDYMKQRNSGLNEVMVKILKRKKMNIYFDFDEIFESKEKERVFARIIQSIELCNREKVQIKILIRKVKRDNYDIRAFMSSLGMPTWMLKNLF